MTPPSVSEEMIRAASVAMNVGFRDFHIPERAIRRSLEAALAHLPAGSEAVKPSDASFPERIWLGCADDNNEHSVWADPDEGGMPYVRADLTAPPSTLPVANVQEGEDPTRTAMKEAEARVMQDYAWGNLSELGVANHLRRAGFNSRYASDKANELVRSKQAPTVAVPDEGGLAELTAALAGKHTGEWSNVLELMPTSCLETLTELVRARAEQRETPSEVVGEDARDAARYRWLRLQNRDSIVAPVQHPKHTVQLSRIDCVNKQRLDEIVDAAMLAAAPTSDGR